MVDESLGYRLFSYLMHSAGILAVLLLNLALLWLFALGISALWDASRNRRKRDG
jgi:hypothetical protein